jgi:hypothetical protein
MMIVIHQSVELDARVECDAMSQNEETEHTRLLLKRASSTLTKGRTVVGTNTAVLVLGRNPNETIM